jgi:hypothetical protein
MKWRCGQMTHPGPIGSIKLAKTQATTGLFAFVERPSRPGQPGRGAPSAAAVAETLGELANFR